MNGIKQSVKYIHYYGVKMFWLKLTKTSFAKKNLRQEMKINKISERELENQKNTIFDKNPKISIIVPSFKTPEIFLREMLDSVINQTYNKWEICIADGSEEDNCVCEIVKTYMKEDNRILYTKLDKNLGIADNTNAAIDMASGDYITLLDHDDLLSVQALYEIVEAINKNPNVDVLYSDEDKINQESTKFFEPHYKSDFNLDLLRSNNYICHLFVVSKEIVKKCGGFQKEFEGAQDYDFILRCVEKANFIIHIPKILYHWRTHAESTAVNPESKLYAYEAGKRAIEAHLKRMGLDANVFHTNNYGFYKLEYQVQNRPLVSIIIERGTYKNRIRRCVKYLKSKTEYENYEINVINRLELIDKKSLNGEYITIVNSSVKVISKKWLENMLGYCQRSDVGMVGAKLYNKDETIRHGGIILNSHMYAFEGLSRVQDGYFHRESLQQNMSGVSLDFVMIKKKILLSTGIIDKSLEWDEREILLCKKVREMGLLIVYNPTVEGYIYNPRKISMIQRNYKDIYYN